MTWTALEQDYLQSLKNSRSLQLAARTWLPRFRSFCTDLGLEPPDLTADHLQAYEESLLWQPGPSGRLYSQNTVYLAARLARLLMRWAFRMERLPQDPTQELRLARPQSNSPKLLTASELAAVLQAPDRERPTGLRDAFYLELLTVFEFKINRCLALDLADAARLTPTPLLEGYLRQGRPQLASRPQESALLLTRDGNRLSLGLAGVIPANYGRQVGLEHRLNARDLARSYRAHHRTPAPLSL